MAEVNLHKEIKTFHEQGIDDKICSKGNSREFCNSTPEAQLNQ